MPGQVYYVGSRKLVLQGADGVVFVADSQRRRMEANLESVRDMEKNLRELGYDLSAVPLVLQCNKRDLPDVAPVPLMQGRLGFDGALCFASVATQGNGVFDTLKAIINLVVRQVQRKMVVVKC